MSRLDGDADRPFPHETREHRRRRLRRRGRRAYIRSVYFLPSLATLGNAICGFGAIYISCLSPILQTHQEDWITVFFANNRFISAAYLIFFAMLFDVLDGRLARFARHTTDFGGQLDSLADVISFGVAPAFVALQVFKSAHPEIAPPFDRLGWAIGALYMACAAVRLARFNVSNEHGEQHHFSFLGLPSPGAAGAIVGMILMQQNLAGNPLHGYRVDFCHRLSDTCIWSLPPLMLTVALLMISNIRYPHVVNRYLRGRRSVARLMAGLVMVLLFVVAHWLVLGLVPLLYTMWGLAGYLWFRIRRRTLGPPVQKVVAK
jgi:CDP-diacylglycerol--serine O-phosphatidyltransferase